MRALILVAVALAGCSSRAPVDFVCTIDGAPSFIVEDADRARYAGDAWHIDTEAMRYVYLQRAGEVCSVEALP